MSPLTNKMVSIQLGNLNKTAKNKWSLNLERVEHAVSHDEPVNAQAQAWLNSLPQKHKTALSKHGLYEESSVPKTFAALCAYMIEKGIKDKNKLGTTSNKTNVLVSAIKFFEGFDVDRNDRSTSADKSTKHIAAITSDDVAEFREWLHQDRPKENSKVDVMKSVIQVFNLAKSEGLVSENVATKHKGKAQWDSYAKPATDLAKKHSFELWPRPLQNLRASFISRKVAGRGDDTPVPVTVICKWVGQSELVAKKHYVVLTDENLQGASTWSFDLVKQKVTQHRSAQNGSGVSVESSNGGFSKPDQPPPGTAMKDETPTGRTVFLLVKRSF